MQDQNTITLMSANAADKEALLNWMQTELADQFGRINQVMGKPGAIRPDLPHDRRGSGCEGRKGHRWIRLD